MESFLLKLRSPLRKWVINVAWMRRSSGRASNQQRRAMDGLQRRVESGGKNSQRAREDRSLMPFSVHAAFIIPPLFAP